MEYLGIFIFEQFEDKVHVWMEILAGILLVMDAQYLRYASSGVIRTNNASKRLRRRYLSIGDSPLWRLKFILFSFHNYIVASQTGNNSQFVFQNIPIVEFNAFSNDNFFENTHV